MARRKSYPGSIERRARSYRIRLCVAGERHYFTMAGVGRKQAEQFARLKYQELEKLAERRAIGLPGSVAFSEFLRQYAENVLPTLSPSSEASYGYSLGPIRLFFVGELRDPLVERIQTGHIQRYLDWRRVHGPRGERLTRPLSNRTIQKERAILHRIFNIAERLELRDGNPVSRTESPKPKGRDPVILPDEEYERLLSECEHNDMLWLYVLSLGETGARCESEALWLRWEDVRLEKGFLWIDSAYYGRRTKSGKGRFVPMTDRLRKAMREHFARYRFAMYAGVQSPWISHHFYSIRSARAGDELFPKVVDCER